MENLKTDNWGTNWLIDRVAGSVTQDENGDYKAGWLQSGLGSALGLDVGAIEDQKETNINRRAGQRVLTQQGYSAEELGLDPNNLTEGGVYSAIRDKNEQKQTDKEERLRSYTVDDRNHASTQATNALTAQLTAQDNRYGFEAQENRRTRAHERQLANMSNDVNMQLGLINAELEEKRMAYNRETQRMDRRDRMIAQLMAGIGQLGGAFSL